MRAAPRRVLVVAGRGRYEDPWHDHAGTSFRVAQLIQLLGHEAVVQGIFPDTLPAAAGFDAVVVNCGRGRADASFDGPDDEWAPVHESFTAAVRAGLPLLALHQAANTFLDSPTWPALIGGRWVEGVSFHPPESVAEFDLARHPVTGALSGQIIAHDERYCSLEVAPDSEVVLTTRWQGVEHPVAWRSAGGPKVLYDGLGHAQRSYDSPTRRELLAAEIAWLLR